MQKPDKTGKHSFYFSEDLLYIQNIVLFVQLYVVPSEIFSNFKRLIKQSKLKFFCHDLLSCHCMATVYDVNHIHHDNTF